MPKKEVIEVHPISTKEAIITITGDNELIINKFNDVAVRSLSEVRKGKAKKVVEKPNVWEEIITSVHWRDGKPSTDPSTWTEETMMDLLKNNAPCVSAFGFAQSMGDAVVRFGIDKFATKFKAEVRVIGDKIPVTFDEYRLDEKLMSPKVGQPVLAHQNKFIGWSAQVHIEFIGNQFTLEQIVNIINLAGFGLGIGSGHKCGYGRYHVSGVELI